MRTRLLERKKTMMLVWVTGALVLLGVLLSPALYYRAGNLFFGEVPALYNVTLANFFFTYAAYPIVGKPAPFAHHQLSRTYFIEGYLSAAVVEAQTELKVYPEHWNTYYILGLTLGYLNRESEAIDAFGQFIAHKPLSWAARNDRAWLQFRMGDIDGALATLAPVVGQTDNAWVQNTYGTLLLNKRRYAEAKTAFLNAQKVVEQMTEVSWGAAYPGNDPRVYSTGLEAMKNSIATNLQLLDSN